MNILVLQHVAFEGAGALLEIFNRTPHSVTTCKLYAEDPLPEPGECDAIVVMGGPMGVSDESRYPWLQDEKAFLQEAIATGKRVLGICLGAQLIADVLGARVYRNAYREIGWFPVNTDRELLATNYGQILGDEFLAFHWHGDTFDLPEGAIPLGSTLACQCQGFVFQQRVIALQFHLEMTANGVAKLVKHCADELQPSEFIQGPDELQAPEKQFAAMHQRMADLVDCWLRA